ncbi:MAG: hypothetical protein WCT53_01705 [Candidatus Gracilibacteria bacterium]
MTESDSQLGGAPDGSGEPLDALLGQSVALEEATAGVSEQVRILTTEHSLVQKAFPGTVPICTDMFINLSREAYRLPWLTRELAQNFVDGNDEHPYSLDGVDFTETKIPAGGSKFNITGHWPFEKATGLLSLHSGKGNPKKRKRKTAGGNGIGLKQTVLRLFRDYKIKSFVVSGEKWEVKYQYVSKEEMNGKLLAEDPESELVENDWLIGTLHSSSNQGSCSYTIEADDEEAIQALREFPNLGATKQNEYLRDPDYENEYGLFKWLPLDAKGRLFVNGQVMQFREKGKTNAEFWTGPEHMSISLHDIDYDMSMDRPPVNAYALSGYVSNLVSRMPTDDIVEQLRRSEYIWGEVEDKGGSDRAASFVLIEQFINVLYYRSFGIARFEAIFGSHYLTSDGDFPKEHRAALVKKGHKFCPEFFRWVGVASASSQLNALDLVSKDKPDPEKSHLNWAAERGGIPVGHEDFKIKNDKEFYKILLKYFGDDIEGVETLNEESRQFKVNLRLGMPVEMHLNQAVTKPAEANMKKLYMLRGLIHYGISRGIFENVVLAEENFVLIFSVEQSVQESDEQVLWMKVVGKKVDPGMYVQPTEAHMPEFSRGLLGKKFKAEKEREQQVLATRRMLEPRRTNIHMPAGIRSAVRGLVYAALGLLAVAGYQNRNALMFSFRSVGQLLSQDPSFELPSLNLGLPDFSSELSSMLKAMSEWVKGNYSDVKMTDVDYAKLNEWLSSDKVYGKSDLRLPNFRSLDDIVATYADAGIESNRSEGSMIEDFEIVQNPSPSHLEQIDLLREYLELSTGVQVSNTIFIYKGKGAFGVNVGKTAIGIHANLFEKEFRPAAKTFSHEVSHNSEMNHENSFIWVLSSVNGEESRQLTKVAAKSLDGRQLTDDERRLVEISRRWDVIVQGRSQ